MPITVTPLDGGSPRILSIRTAYNQVSDHVDLVPIAAALGVGQPITVTLKDGSLATFALTENVAQPELELDEPDPHYPVEALRQNNVAPLHRPFNAHCKVLLDLDVFVQCMALDQVHAERIIQEVFRGERSPPDGFRPVFDHDDTQAFTLRLRHVLDSSDVSKIVARDALVTSFVDPLQVLEYRP